MRIVSHFYQLDLLSFPIFQTIFFLILFHGHFNVLFEGWGNYTEDCVVVCT